MRSLQLRQIALGDPVPDRWIDIACGLACDLAADPGNQLVHGDWLWGLAAGLTEDPRRCERMLATLDP